MSKIQSEIPIPWLSDLYLPQKTEHEHLLQPKKDTPDPNTILNDFSQKCLSFSAFLNIKHAGSLQIEKGSRK